MRNLRLGVPPNTSVVLKDERTGEIRTFEDGDVLELEYDAAIATMLQGNAALKFLSPIKLRSGFLVHWRESNGDPAEGLLVLECAFQRTSVLEEWLLVEQAGQSRFVPRGQLIGWDPAPMINALRAVYRQAPSDRAPLLAEDCLRALIDTPEAGYERPQ